MKNKKIKNFSFKSKIKTLIKKTYKYLNIINYNKLDNSFIIDNLNKFIFYYKLFLKNIDIIKKKNIFKKNKSSRLKKMILLNIKKKLFF
ncbi:hypothetical protein CA212_141 [Candidatus Nasuia deltocephalinicola]|nr:hypothetical protein CA212_141 [Candidatus Nasuia deltocephalinicola]